MKAYKMGFLFFMALLVSACDLTSDAVLGKKAVRPPDEYTDRYSTSQCDRLVVKQGVGCFTEDLDEVLVDLQERSTQETKVKPNPSSLKVRGGMVFSFKELRDKRKVTIAEVIYRRTSGVEYDISLTCNPAVEDPVNSSFSTQECALVTPEADKKFYRLYSLRLKVGECVAEYVTASDKTKCSSYDNDTKVTPSLDAPQLP